MNLQDYRSVWEKKKSLQTVYRDLYRHMQNAAVQGGRSLEIGGGIGNFALPNVSLLKLDVQASTSIDLIADAHWLPFSSNSFSNIFLVDVLHHLDCPLKFLQEAERTLCPGGRLIMVEPGISLLSNLLYRLGHEELVDMNWQPSLDCNPRADKDPYEANQAIPTVLFFGKKDYLKTAGLRLQLVTKRRLSAFAYPLSGGFKSWSLLPTSWVQPLLKVEEWILPTLGHLLAFRILVVLEKNAN